MALRPDSKDIDGGWAFVVLTTIFLLNTIIYGLTFTSAIIYVTFLEEFEQSPATTAWAVNLPIFIVFLFGEPTNMVVRLVGHRSTTVIGCVLSSCGIVASSFATSLTWVFVTNGTLIGVGFGLSCYPQYEVITHHFVKYRAIAYVVCACGISAGLFVYAPVMRFLIDEYHWRGAFIILGAINLNMMLAAAAAIPPRVAGTAGIEEEELLPKQSRRARIASIRHHLRDQLSNLRLFARPRWTLFCVSYFFSSLGSSAFLTHISKLARDLGYSEQEAALLPSTIGAASLCTRVAIGVIVYKKWIHVVGVYLILFSTIGSANLLCSFWRSYVGLVISACCFGAGTAGYAVFAEAVIHIVGVEKVGPGVSFSSLTSTLAMFSGGAVAGRIYELDPSYVSSFVTIGSLALAGGLLNLPSWITCKDGRVEERRPFDEVQDVAHEEE